MGINGQPNALESCPHQFANPTHVHPDRMPVRSGDDLVVPNPVVQSTHDRIKAALAADAWARVDAVVQSEKRHMKIGVGGGQQ